MVKPLSAHLEIDLTTGASICRRAGMSLILKITERQLDRLVLAGKLPVREDGRFHVREAIDAYAIYVQEKASRPSVHDRIRVREAERLRRKLEREAATLVLMADALSAIDLVTGAFTVALVDVERQITPVVSDPVRATTALTHTKSELEKRWARTRRHLECGQPSAE